MKLLTQALVTIEMIMIVQVMRQLTTSVAIALLEVIIECAEIAIIIGTRRNISNKEMNSSNNKNDSINS